MKKITKLLIVLIIVLTLFGCQRKKSNIPNENRGTNYKYDFVDYIDIYVYGEDGEGYLEIVPKEISMNDFENEQDYINVKRDLEEFNFHYLQGSPNPKNFSILATTNLKNGYIITITPSTKIETRSDLNVEPYDYVVRGLGEAKDIDLFSSELVSFYALTDGSYHAYVKNNPAYPEDIRNNLIYTISTKDKPVAGQAVLDVNVDMDAEYLKEQNCANITLYLAKQNLKSSLQTQKVLTDVLDPIDMATANSSAIEAELYRYIGKKDKDLVKIANLQQTERQRSAEPYTYVVVYATSDNSKDNPKRQWYRYDIKMVSVDGEYTVLYSNNRTTTNESYSEQPYDGANILLNFMIDQGAPDNNEAPEENNVEEPSAQDQEVNE